MLVLSIRTGQSVAIGDEIRLVVVKSTAGQIRIGIDAPATVKIKTVEPTNDLAEDHDIYVRK